MTTLLDANALIALVVADHVHHPAATAWFAARDAPFASCPITQGALIRFLIREGRPSVEAKQVIDEIEAHRRHEFWPDAVSYSGVRMAGVIGHRQVTDVYLAELARARRGRLATFDQGLAAMQPDVIELLAGSP